MRALLISLLLVLALCAPGCRKRTLGSFPLKAGMTMQDFEDQMGSPDIQDAHWIAYKLEDGTQLRLYFLEGPRGSNRTLTAATLWKEGTRLRDVFTVTPPATNPATAPSTHPAP